MKNMSAAWPHRRTHGVDSQDALHDGEEQVEEADADHSVEQGTEPGPGGETEIGSARIHAVLPHTSVSHLLDDAVAQAGDDHQDPGQSPLHGGQHLGEHHGAVDWTGTQQSLRDGSERFGLASHLYPPDTPSYRRLWNSA